MQEFEIVLTIQEKPIGTLTQSAETIEQASQLARDWIQKDQSVLAERCRASMNDLGFEVIGEDEFLQIPSMISRVSHQ
jgi:hypothetical protein